MAGKPIKLFGAYYSRIYIPKGRTKYREKKIHLGTSNKAEADARWLLVKQAEGAIKGGMDVSFPWDNGEANIKIEKYILKTAIKDYLQYKKSERIKQTSIDRIKIALDHFQSTIGKSIPICDIDINHIDLFKQYYSNEVKHKPNTVNNNLAKVRALLGWLYDRGKIDNIPKITKLRVGTKLPMYITDNEWNKILNLDYVIRKHYGYTESFDEHWKRAFYFYRETGCRLNEPFNGRLEGNWLIIDNDESKTNRTREIFIPNELIPILLEMQDRVKNSDSINKRGCIQSYSRKFKYACDTVGIDKYLHCLRDTFAIRRYLETDNIYDVAKDLGHSTVKTTERYMNFDKRRLKQDFPTIVNSWKSVEKPQNHTKSYINHRTEIETNLSTIVGKV